MWCVIYVEEYSKVVQVLKLSLSTKNNVKNKTT